MPKVALTRVRLRLGVGLPAESDREGAMTHQHEAGKGIDPAVARQAERAMREMGIR